MADNFTLFYHTFMRGVPRDRDFWKRQDNSPATVAWSGMAFKRVYLEHIPQIKQALGISGVQTQMGA